MRPLMRIRPMNPTPDPSPASVGGEAQRSAAFSPPTLAGEGSGEGAIFLAFAIDALVFASASLAADRQLTGAEIAALLPRIVAAGDDDRQTFAVNGETLYSKAGKDRLGRWEVRGDRYCSLFPPATDWTCRAIHAEGPDKGLPARLTWTGDDGKPLKKLVRIKEAQP